MKRGNFVGRTAKALNPHKQLWGYGYTGNINACFGSCNVVSTSVMVDRYCKLVRKIMWTWVIEYRGIRGGDGSKPLIIMIEAHTVLRWGWKWQKLQMFMNILVPEVEMSDWDLTIHYHAFEVESSYLAEKKDKFWSYITFIPHLFPLTPPHRILHMKGGGNRK